MGDYLLFAPVTECGSSSRRVYLPEGEWINRWTQETLQGGREIEVEAPLMKIEGIPLFVKRGGTVVRQKPEMTLNKDFPEELIIEFYPHPKAAIELYESEAVRNLFQCELNGKGLSLLLQNNTPRKRKYTVYIFGKNENRASDGSQTESHNGFITFEAEVGSYSEYCHKEERNNDM